MHTSASLTMQLIRGHHYPLDTHRSIHLHLVNGQLEIVSAGQWLAESVMTSQKTLFSGDYLCIEKGSFARLHPLTSCTLRLVSD